MFWPSNKPPCPGSSVRELNTLWACSLGCEISLAPTFTTSGRFPGSVLLRVRPDVNEWRRAVCETEKMVVVCGGLAMERAHGSGEALLYCRIVIQSLTNRFLFPLFLFFSHQCIHPTLPLLSLSFQSRTSISQPASSELAGSILPSPGIP